MKKRYMAALFSLILVFGWTCTSQAAELKFFKIVSTSPGGIWHTFGIQLADALQKELPGISINHAPGGSNKNHIMVNNNEAQMGFSFTPVSLEAYLGKGPYKKPYKDVRVIGTHFATFLHPVVRKGTNITHISQLKNKVVSPGKRGWGTTAICMQILKMYGITPESMKEAGGMMQFLGFPDVTSMMQDRRLDAFMYYSSVPSPLLLTLSENPGIDLPPYTEKDVEMILSKLEPKGAFIKLQYPKNPYKGVKGDFPCPIMWSIFLVNKDVPDDIVYKVTKVLYETKSLRDFMGGGSSLNLQYATAGLKGGPIPFHPGAIRYFKDKGVW
jgi:TRAP transporter TAXI family solute receptor